MSSVEDRIKNLSPHKRALLEQRMAAARAPRSAEPIAIVGVGCRYPGGVEDLGGLAALLASGEDGVGDTPADRWDVDAHYAPDREARGKLVSRRGGFLPDIRSFDAEFFAISPREAASMDPQQRLLLEVSYEAFEDAGIPLPALRGTTTGVYVGITLSEYAQLRSGDPRDIDVYSGTGSYLNVAAGRLSYVYDLQGPCMAVDAACASSLVTVHLACQALRGGECNLALAGGVSLMLAPETTIYLSQTGALAPDGRCKTFDARADGYVRAEGCGLLVLKRLSDAVRDRDRIHAVIRGSAVSQDGASSGLTAPNGRAQQRVIQAALRDAGVHGDEVSYVEAHGTGTPLGDPIEMGAIQAVYGARRQEPLHVGSLKTNLGHAEAAAGVGGILRVIVALRERQIPAHRNFETLNPLISIDPGRVVIPTAPAAWPARPDRPRLAGVSSFGFSGVIAHAILEEAPPPAPPVAAAPAPGFPLHVVPVTARHAGALDRRIAQLAAAAATLDDDRLADLCFTACHRRSHHAHRAWFAFRTRDELAGQLEAAARGREAPGAVLGRRASDDLRVAMVFPGQGSQWLGMGRELMQHARVFRDAIHDIDRALRRWATFSLLDVLAATGDPFDQVAVVQPTIFALQVALARQWQAWGIRPHAVIGHSMGEVAAACVAGALSLDDAAAVICRRSQRVSTTTGRGAMALVEIAPAEAEQAVAALGPRIAIAAYNGPSTVLVSGEPAALDEVLAVLAARGAFCRKVKVDYASHCAQMDPLLDAIRAELAHVRPRAGQVPIYSTVRGEVLGGAELDAGYWADNLRRPVRFHDQLRAVLAAGVQVVLEVSPHPVLAPAMQKTIDELGGAQVVVPSMRRDDELGSVATALGTLFCLGAPVDLAQVSPATGQLVELPRYPWQRREFWLASPGRPRARGTAGHPLLGSPLRPAVGPESLFWELDLDDERLAFLADHQVRDMTMVPGTAYLDLALAAARAGFGDRRCELTGVAFQSALTILPDQPRRLQISFVRDGESFAVAIASRAAAGADDWTVHATLRLGIDEGSRVAGGGVPDGCAGGAGELPRGIDERSRVAGGGVPDGCAGGAGELPREIDEGSRVAGGGVPDGCAGGAGELPRGIDERSRVAGGGDTGEPMTPPDGAERCDARSHYRRMRDSGLHYGPRFQGVAEIHAARDEAVAVLRTAVELGLDSAAHVFHPALWDAAHQVLASLLARRDGGQPVTWIPLGIERAIVRGSAPPDEPLHVRARIRPGDGERACGDVAICDRAGRVLVETRGLALLRRDADQLDDVDRWLFHTVVREAPAAPAARGIDGVWIVLGERDAVRAAITAELARCGAAVVAASPGPAWAVAEGALQLSPSDPAQLRRLIDHVTAERPDRPLRGIVNLRPLQIAGVAGAWADAGAGADAGGGVDAGAGADGVITALYLEALHQALVLQAREPAPRLVLVSGSADDAPVPGAAPLQGLARVLATELPRLRCVQVELAGRDVAAEAGALVRELAASDDETEVVLRGDVRCVRRLERLAAPAAAPVRIAAGATYLITGGLGGLGLVFARWLVERGATHVVLVGRRPPSPAAREAIEALRARAEITIEPIDIAAPAEVAALFASLDRARPPLAGVLHLAGVLDDATVFQQDERRLASVLAPKVTGARLLHEHTRGRALEFFVLFSGAAALLGSAGQANYAAANAYLGALAHHRRRLGLPALAIDWGVWDEVGLAAASALRGERLQDHGLVAIRPALGVEAFARALGGPHAHVAILPIRLARWLGHYPELARSSLFKELARRAAVPGDDAAPIPEQLRALTDPREQRAHLQRWLDRQVAAVLRRDPASLQHDESFAAMGVDSLMALELRNRLERALQVRLPPSLVFNHPSLEALGAFLAGKLAIEGATGASSPPHGPAAAPPGVTERDGAALLGALSRLKSLTPPA